METKKSWKEKLSSLSEKAALLLMLGSGLATAMALFARRHWLLETAVHFRLQYLVALLLAAIILLLRNRRPAALLALLLALPNLLPLLPYYTPHAAADSSEETYRVLMMNVLYENESFADVLDLIDKSDADFVVLVEMSEAWDTAVLPQMRSYPHVRVAHTDWRYKTYLFSRHSFADNVETTIGSHSRPAVTAIFDLNGQSFRLVGAHPTSPSRPWRIRSRNHELQLLAEDIAAASEPTMLVGDLNITPFSPHFDDLMKNAGL